MKTVWLFTRNGLGDAPENLQQTLAIKFLSLNLQNGILPSQILFYGDGVKLSCEGSLCLQSLRLMEDAGVELIVCTTCLEFFGLREALRAGRAGGMPDIIASLNLADKVISL